MLNSQRRSLSNRKVRKHKHSLRSVKRNKSSKVKKHAVAKKKRSMSRKSRSKSISKQIPKSQKRTLPMQNRIGIQTRSESEMKLLLSGQKFSQIQRVLGFYDVDIITEKDLFFWCQSSPKHFTQLVRWIMFTCPNVGEVIGKQWLLDLAQTLTSQQTSRPRYKVGMFVAVKKGFKEHIKNIKSLSQVKDWVGAFLVYKKGGCQLKRKSFEVIQLTLVCGNSDKRFRKLGTCLISLFLVWCRLQNIRYIVLELAVQGIDEGFKYDDIDFQSNKQAQSLMCHYARFGFENNSDVALKWKCFQKDYPYPSMVFDTKKYLKQNDQVNYLLDSTLSEVMHMNDVSATSSSSRYVWKIPQHLRTSETALLCQKVQQ